MNTLDTAAIRARCEAATRGKLVLNTDIVAGAEVMTRHGYYIGEFQYRGDALFFDAARTDVPALLDALAAAEAEHLAAYQRVIRENDDCWRQVKTLMERITALAAIAHDLADQEHGARCEQISALARLGIIVTPAEHVQRADAQQAAHHRRIDTALAEAAPATREE